VRLVRVLRPSHEVLPTAYAYTPEICSACRKSEKVKGDAGRLDIMRGNDRSQAWVCSTNRLAPPAAGHDVKVTTFIRTRASTAHAAQIPAGVACNSPCQSAKADTQCIIMVASVSCGNTSKTAVPTCKLGHAAGRAETSPHFVLSSTGCAGDSRPCKHA
jgi:hypothetical protein